MLIPDAEQAHIPLDKLEKYLLSDSHPVGKAKSAFFRSLGFSIGNVEEFEGAIREIILQERVHKTLPISYGTKYIVDGILKGKSQLSCLVRTVWIREEEGRPRLVTVYPRDGLRKERSL
jgi:hypothetical protein